MEVRQYLLEILPSKKRKPKKGQRKLYLVPLIENKCKNVVILDKENYVKGIRIKRVKD
jgi:tRNA uridine 5-carbamoylmethylation protein Kti12